jgi:hypothetical protein
MNDLVKEYMETGKDLNTICDDKIKENNRNWFLLFALFTTVWIGYSVTIGKRMANITYEHSKCDSIHKVDALTIEMQKKCLEGAVYFEDIK